MCGSRSCLTLEYGVSSAAMARIWGEKLVTWLDHMGYRLWDPRGNTINIYAGVSLWRYMSGPM